MRTVKPGDIVQPGESVEIEVDIPEYVQKTMHALQSRGVKIDTECVGDELRFVAEGKLVAAVRIPGMTARGVRPA